jgi:hypothetical protein
MVKPGHLCKPRTPEIIEISKSLGDPYFPCIQRLEVFWSRSFTKARARAPRRAILVLSTFPAGVYLDIIMIGLIAVAENFGGLPCDPGLDGLRHICVQKHGYKSG